jgi:hypothetical protein
LKVKRETYNSALAPATYRARARAQTDEGVSSFVRGEPPLAAARFGLR